MMPCVPRFPVVIRAGGGGPDIAQLITSPLARTPRPYMSGLGVVWIPLRLFYPSAKWTELPLNAETPGDCDHYPSLGARPATGGFVDWGPTEIPDMGGWTHDGTYALRI